MSDQPSVLPPGGQPRQGRRPYAVFATALLALAAAGASAWFIGRGGVQCDSLAPLTVLATLAAFIISICFRQMGRYPDRRIRWMLLAVLLIAAATIFTDFRYVRRYRGFCDELRQQMTQPPPR